IEVPFDLVNDHVFVRASVNGLPADLIVDTGSSISTLSEPFAARSGVKPLEGLASAAGASRVP
ncbi:MAG TPA: aspartyl protease family protein, partial [Myxococcales bacterium]|nr:aspartyl protease family protein [Myxococcales bacterium]